MQGNDIGEVVLLGTVEGDIAELRTNAGFDAQTVECGQRVLQAHTEFADEARMIELLLVLVHREVLVAQAAAKISDAPYTLSVAGKDDFMRAGQHLLVERVGDDFPDSMERIPVFEHPVDVQVEFLHR